MGPVAASEGEFTVHPRALADARAGALLGGAFWILASVGFLLRFHGIALLVVGALDAAVLVLIVGYGLFARPRTALSLRNRQLTLLGVRGDRLILKAGDGGRVVELDVSSGSGVIETLSRVWLVVAEDGTVVLKLNRAAWRREDLDAVRAGLGLRAEVIEGTQSASTVRELYPDVVPWRVVHPWLFSALLMGAIVVIGTAIDAALH